MKSLTTSRLDKSSLHAKDLDVRNSYKTNLILSNSSASGYYIRNPIGSTPQVPSGVVEKTEIMGGEKIPNPFENLLKTNPCY